jgi:hypothetical protein
VGASTEVPRRAFAVETLVLPLDGRLRGFRASCHDITHRGLLIASTRPMPVDTLVVLRLHVGRRPLLELTAQVIHSLPGQGFGCLFLDLDENSRRVVSLLVAACRAAPPHMRTIRRPPRQEASDAVTRPRWRVA